MSCTHSTIQLNMNGGGAGGLTAQPSTKKASMEVPALAPRLTELTPSIVISTADKNLLPNLINEGFWFMTLLLSCHHSKELFLRDLPIPELLPSRVGSFLLYHMCTSSQSSQVPPCQNLQVKAPPGASRVVQNNCRYISDGDHTLPFKPQKGAEI